MVRWGRGAEAHAHGSDVSFRLDQETGNFKVTFAGRPMQWSGLAEEKQKNQIAQTEFRFKKTIIIRKAAAITRGHLPPHQRYTRVKDGKFQGGHSQQSDAMECFDCRKAKESTRAKRVLLPKSNNDNKSGENYSQVFASTSALH